MVLVGVNVPTLVKLTFSVNSSTAVNHAQSKLQPCKLRDTNSLQIFHLTKADNYGPYQFLIHI